MRYFILSQDGRISDAVEPMGVTQIITKERMKEEYRHELEELTLQFPIRETNKCEYIDFIERPVPLASDKLKSILTTYDPHLYVKWVIVADRKRTRQEKYWLFIPPCVECLSDRSEFHKNGTSKRLVIDERKVGSQPVFTIAGIRESYILVNLAVAESVLRRGMLGIRFTRVETEAR
ncbi:hypothetical protein [Aneurinibacillus aneurinilyticus]|uniref:Uncharacterized protein n=1 Tax=Aneurinibacillus aneurinilyticus ATCC 12856 TaxID=649747 RepID=U1X374_ANEAE|nr:hypothetical protein [Aneurinibacillus aneurinilyticus]ERI09430.1 hypothetical protein HMPREF0083_02476 [Aneurinibacillus aneurinilyticus ATCC 12856]MED0706055.1 serine protease [Aneurinibacillus aneurinilyticus]MED0726394.1 serine protease [Aneurinibacillus aneurinilyticus]MED0735185.1 serine protease [Aneurinibacillus aneurinilyticus]MED0743542.1 serine protease [Aneurinibacillus aneurinilyticus]